MLKSNGIVLAFSVSFDLIFQVQGLNSLYRLAVVGQLFWSLTGTEIFSNSDLTECHTILSNIFKIVFQDQAVPLLDPEDDGTMIPQLVWNHNTAGHPRRLEASAAPLWEPHILQESSPYCHNEVGPGTHPSFFQFLLGDIILRGKMDGMWSFQGMFIKVCRAYASTVLHIFMVASS